MLLLHNVQIVSMWLFLSMWTFPIQSILPNNHLGFVTVIIVNVCFRFLRKAARQFMINIAKRFQKRVVRPPTARSAPGLQRKTVKLFMRKNAKRFLRISAKMNRWDYIISVSSRTLIRTSQPRDTTCQVWNQPSFHFKRLHNKTYCDGEETLIKIKLKRITLYLVALFFWSEFMPLLNFEDNF